MNTASTSDRCKSWPFTRSFQRCVPIVAGSSSQKMPCHLAFGEVVGEDARAPPKCSGLHFLAQARPHVIRPELPEKEPSPAHEHARRLTGKGSAALCKQVPGHMESEDCIEAGTLQGQAAGVGQDKFDIRKQPATKLKGLSGRCPGRRFSSRRACPTEFCRRRSPAPGQPSPQAGGADP